ncbi:hypothetical protein AYL99_11872 [Fonsecaea erecta]|uniref:Uncharacterized protein n=1 Tax=Fonsecaea erecta TaxID=1367422 RepID=A0A178Z224_9EURO|nr:hypothetical protein AYL99_11872 [Fonsecaea erecta]OAP53850.1 hypothetical protein AYL99_11872 [Fonsecaea erecta]
MNTIIVIPYAWYIDCLCHLTGYIMSANDELDFTSDDGRNEWCHRSQRSRPHWSRPRIVSVWPGTPAAIAAGKFKAQAEKIRSKSSPSPAEFEHRWSDARWIAVARFEHVLHVGGTSAVDGSAPSSACAVASGRPTRSPARL